MNPDSEKEPRWAGFKEVVTMAGPMVLASVSYTMMHVVDTLFVGRLGTAPLAAVGSAGLWAYIASTLFIGMVSIVSTFVAQSLGRGEKENCARYAWQGIYFALATSVVGLILWPLAPAIFGSMPHTAQVQAYETQYFQWRMIGFCLIPWQTVLASFFTAVNMPRIPMLVAFAANIFNALLDYALIFGTFGFPRLEIEGAAIATVISLLIQCLILQALFCTSRMNRVFGVWSAWRLDWIKIRELSRIGFGAGLGMLLDVAMWGVFTSYIVGKAGDTALAAHNVTITVISLSFMPAVGLNQAIAPIVGQWIGRGDIPRAKARAYTAMRLAMAYMFIMGFIFAVSGAEIVTQFNQDPAVIAMGARLLFLAAIFQTFDAVNITLMGALRGAGDTRWMAIMMAIASYFVFLPLALFMSITLGWGAHGAWIGATIYICGLAFVFYRRFAGERWTGIQIFEKDRAAARREKEAQVTR